MIPASALDAAAFGADAAAMHGIVVRTFEARDVAPANALTNHYIEKTAVHFAYEPAPDAEFEAGWRSGSAQYPWLTAELDGHVIGYAKAGRWRDREAYSRTTETGVYVQPELHGKGVGQALMVALLARLQQTGFRTAIAGIALPNPVSIRLHEALGFKPVGIFRGVGCKFGQWHDVGFWQYDFGV